MLIPREQFADLYERIKASAEESNRRSCAEAAALASSAGGAGGLDEDGVVAAPSTGAAGGCFVLILAAMSADAVCAARMLTTLLGHDAITFRLVPVAGNGDVQRAVLTAREPSIVLLDCGATANLTQLRGVPEYACVYVIDSHMPGEWRAPTTHEVRVRAAPAARPPVRPPARASPHRRVRPRAPHLTLPLPPAPAPHPPARSAPLQRARSAQQAVCALVAAAHGRRAR